MKICSVKISIAYSKQPGKQPFFMGNLEGPQGDHQERGGKPTAHH